MWQQFLLAVISYFRYVMPRVSSLRAIGNNAQWGCCSERQSHPFIAFASGCLISPVRVSYFYIVLSLFCSLDIRKHFETLLDIAIDRSMVTVPR